MSLLSDWTEDPSLLKMSVKIGLTPGQISGKWTLAGMMLVCRSAPLQTPSLISHPKPLWCNSKHNSSLSPMLMIPKITSPKPPVIAPAPAPVPPTQSSPVKGTSLLHKVEMTMMAAPAQTPAALQAALMTLTTVPFPLRRFPNTSL